MRYTKKQVSLSLVLLLLLSLLLCPLSGGAEYPEEILEILHGHIEKEFGVTPEEYRIYTLETDGKEYVFGVRLREYPLNSDGSIAGRFTIGGELLEIRGPQEVGHLRQFERELSESLADPEAMYVLKVKWEAILEELPFGGVLYPKYEEVIALDISAPGENSISMDAAREIARETVLSLPGWSEEAFEMFFTRMFVHYTRTGDSVPIYLFLFEYFDIMDEKYDGDDWRTLYNEDLEKLYALFGGDSATTPHYVRVRINAETGDLYAEPEVYYPPIEFHYLDHLLL